MASLDHQGQCVRCGKLSCSCGDSGTVVAMPPDQPAPRPEVTPTREHREEAWRNGWGDAEPWNSVAHWICTGTITTDWVGFVPLEKVAALLASREAAAYERGRTEALGTLDRAGEFATGEAGQLHHLLECYLSGPQQEIAVIALRLQAAEERGRLLERTAVVRWLLWRADNIAMMSTHRGLAGAIDRGDHLAQAEESDGISEFFTDRYKRESFIRLAREVRQDPRVLEREGVCDEIAWRKALIPAVEPPAPDQKCSACRGSGVGCDHCQGGDALRHARCERCKGTGKEPM